MYSLTKSLGVKSNLLFEVIYKPMKNITQLVGQQCLNFGPWTTPHITKKSVRNAHPQAPSRPTESITRGVGLGILFNKLPGDSDVS